MQLAKNMPLATTNRKTCALVSGSVGMTHSILVYCVICVKCPTNHYPDVSNHFSISRFFVVWFYDKATLKIMSASSPTAYHQHQEYNPEFYCVACWWAYSKLIRCVRGMLRLWQMRLIWKPSKLALNITPVVSFSTWIKSAKTATVTLPRIETNAAALCDFR